MWLWLLIQLVPIRPALNNAWALENPTSNGPVSTEEGRLLWADGRKAFEDGRYQDAVNNLQRLVDRYPGYPGYLEAHRLLGRSLMILGRPEEAEKPLKAYVNATGNRPLGLQARLWLGEDYLMMSKPNEAYLTALGVEKATRGSKSRVYAESQFLKTRALIGLNQDRRAQRVLDSIALDPLVRSDPVLKGHLARTQIQLKLRSCGRSPGAGPMSDGQARDGFQQRSLCLQEALALFRAAAESGDTGTVRDAGGRIADAYRAYARDVRQPPAPARLKPVPRTPAQMHQYKAELSDRLEQDRRKAVSEALATLSSWRTKALSSGTANGRASAEAYETLAREIR